MRARPEPARSASRRVVSRRARTDRDVSRLAQEVFALPARLADDAAAQGRRRARRVPGHRRLQRRIRRARAARRRAAPARRRLRLRRLGAEPDGADARAAAAVLQGRTGDAARKDSPAIVRRVHRRAVHHARAFGRDRPRRRRSSSSPATCRTTCSGSRTRPGTKCARPARKRATLDDLHDALHRLLAEQQMMFEGVWQRLTLRAARRAARGRARRRARAAVGRRAHAPPARRPLDRAGGARGARARRSRRARRRRATSVVDSLLREWVARRTF